jgi:hypothetical protein
MIPRQCQGEERDSLRTSPSAQRRDTEDASESHHRLVQPQMPPVRLAIDVARWGVAITPKA